MFNKAKRYGVFLEANGTRQRRGRDTKPTLVLRYNIFNCRTKPALHCNHFGNPKNQFFGNNSDKPQLIRAKFGTHAQVKGRQRSRNFGRDWPIGAKWGRGQTTTAEPEFLFLSTKRDNF